MLHIEISSGQDMNRLLTELKHEEESNVVT